MYGDGDKPARDRAYAAAMEKISRDYPDDAEAALFYALSLMGTVRPEDPAGVQTRLRAGAIASEVYKKNPNHPGAAHYVSMPLTIPNTREHSTPRGATPNRPRSATRTSHALAYLSATRDVAGGRRSNEASWAASVKWVKRRICRSVIVIITACTG